MNNSRTVIEALKQLFVKYNPMGFNEYKKKTEYDTEALKTFNQLKNYQNVKQVEEDLNFHFFERFHDHDMDCEDLAREIYNLKKKSESVEFVQKKSGDDKIKIGGIYEHYKGKTYKVHGVVRHSETLDKMVMYECLYENELGKMWVRPLDMFVDSVEFEGMMRNRFELIHN